MSDFVVAGDWEYSGLTKLSGGLELNSLVAASGDLTLQSVAGKSFLFSEGKCNIGSISDGVEISAGGDSLFTVTGRLTLGSNTADIDIKAGGIVTLNIDGVQNVSFMNCASYNVTTVGGVNYQCNGFNIDSNTGFLVCHGVIGSSYVDDVAIASDAPNFNFARNTATSLFFGNFSCATTMQFSTLDMFAATSMQINSTALNIGNTGTTTALNLGNGACVTKIILQTPSVGTQPLMIDADGTIHV